MMSIYCPDDEHIRGGAYDSIFPLYDKIYVGAHNIGFTHGNNILGATFSERRNELLALALSNEHYEEYDWLGYIDPDERVVNAAAIREELLSLPLEKTACTIRIVAPHTKLNDTVVIDDVWYCRFARPHSGLVFESGIHETWLPTAARSSTNIHKIESGYIHHLGYDVPKEQIREKIQRNQAVYMSILSKGEADARLMYHMGKQYLLIPDEQKAYDCFVTAKALGAPEGLDVELDKMLEILRKGKK